MNFLAGCLVIVLIMIVAYFISLFGQMGKDSDLEEGTGEFGSYNETEDCDCNPAEHDFTN